MDSEMIERCVMAASSQFIGETDIINIIKALREPTENMKVAGSIDPGSGGPDEGYETEVWQAMIDSILND